MRGPQVDMDARKSLMRRGKIPAWMLVFSACCWGSVACSGFSLGFSPPWAPGPTALTARVHHTVRLRQRVADRLGPSLLRDSVLAAGPEARAAEGIRMVLDSRGDEGQRGARRGRGRGRGGSGAGQRVRGQWNRDAVVVKDLGLYNGTSLQLLDAGNGPYVNWGPVNTKMPAHWREKLDDVTNEMVQDLLVQRMDACTVLRIVGLPYKWVEEDVHDLVSGFDVAKGGVKLHLNRDGIFHGQAYVRFEESREANACMRAIDELELDGRVLHVYKQLSGGPFKPLLSTPGGNRGNETMQARLNRIVDEIVGAPVCEDLQRAMDSIESSSEAAVFETGVGDLAENEHVSASLAASNTSDRTACKIISELGKRGELEKAFAVYSWMRGSGDKPVNQFHFNALITACDRRSRWMTALRLMGEMNATDVEPDTITYSALISACGRGKQWELASRLLERMHADQVRPNIITYNSLISACEKAGRLDQALAVFDKLLASGLDPDVITYSALISACEKVGSAETAVELFKEMTSCGLKPDVITYNALISACDKGLRPQQAQATFNDLVESGLEPDGISYCSLISAFASVGDAENARKVLEQFHETDLKPTIGLYNEVIRSCEPDGMYAEAVGYYKEIKERGIPMSAYTLGLLLSVCRKAGQTQLAQAFETELAQCSTSNIPP